MSPTAFLDVLIGFFCRVLHPGIDVPASLPKNPGGARVAQSSERLSGCEPEISIAIAKQSSQELYDYWSLYQDGVRCFVPRAGIVSSLGDAR